eukprot:Protomagalhaensia_sp_Gyna_25__1160@NODE_156_length_4776_cov_112_214482_g121_i0_p5_GENE_NODE_156_length_4776_cov_112_214482_g121_i0NODE_156_length_4776_cov_112_214482_g121_i0_p5_ORF_typecomplete_len198_score27_88NUDIX/PF00293_28/1_4e13_NODE_156_length_4776_cov_112_214482_g121_i012391832
MRILSWTTVALSMAAASMKEAQRAFMITYVEDQGFLLMEASKPSKGRYWQLPGGRIDPGDFEAFGFTASSRRVTLDELVRVGQRAALRELWEETGIDLQKQITRLQYLPGVTEKVAKKKKNLGHTVHEHPRKLFYYVEIASKEFDASNVKLSPEHIAWRLVPDLAEAAHLTRLHSGGDSGSALREFEKEAPVFLPAE